MIVGEVPSTAPVYSRDCPIGLLYNGGMGSHASTSNGAGPAAIKVSRKQAAANALGLLRAEGLEPSPEHEALAARWVAGEIDNEELERLGTDLVRERLASTAVASSTSPSHYSPST